MKSSMKRWLALDIIEGKPKNLKETNEAINKKKGLKYEKGKITSEYIKGKDKEGKEYEILIMKSEELMKLIFSRKDKEVFEVFVDGTFRVVPKRIKGKQFVTISILYHGHVSSLHLKIILKTLQNKQQQKLICLNFTVLNCYFIIFKLL